MYSCSDGCLRKPAESWVCQTLLYRRWEAIRKEIMLHKWYESEKAGYDIGWERAAIDWMIKYGCAEPERKTAQAGEG